MVGNVGEWLIMVKNGGNNVEWWEMVGNSG